MCGTAILTVNMSVITKQEAALKDFVIVKDKKTSAISKIIAPHSLQIGIDGFKNNGSGLLVKGNETVEGSLIVKGGVLGALKLPDGSLAIKSGNGVNVFDCRNGSVILSLADNYTPATISVAPHGGLVKTVVSGAIFLSINSSSFPDFTNPVKFNQGPSGSLTKLSDGSSYLKAGTGISILTASNGSITISSTETQVGVSFSSELVMNGEITGGMDGINKSFTLPDEPANPASFMLWLNGQLLTQGSDYSLSGQGLTFLADLAPDETDILRSMYSKRVVSKGYALSESPAQTFSSGSTLTGIKLSKKPEPASSLMLFLNGQLLAQGPEHDYSLQDETVTFNKSMFTADTILTTYCYAT